MFCLLQQTIEANAPSLALLCTMAAAAAGHSPPSSLREPSDQTSIAWRDDAFLSTYPLDRRTVLDYFAGSPFYDRQCNNEVARSRGLGVESLP